MSNSKWLPREALRVVNTLFDASVKGIGPLCSSRELANTYLSDRSYRTDAARLRSLVNWESARNFTTGFITGLGGLLTLPLAVPVALGASWIIQARMVGGIACIRGYRIDDDRVRTLMLLAMVGDGVKEVLKDAGVQVGRKVGLQVIEAIPGRTLIEINKRVGFRLLTKAGEKGIVNLTKVLPVLGGGIAGTIDAVATRRVAATAMRLFPGAR